MTEEWRSVVGHEDNYEVSALGRVRSLDRVIRECTGRLRRMKGRIVTGSAAWQHPNGKWRYAEVALTDCARGKVHLLVLEAFHGPRPAGLIARHLNGNGSDNRADNLRWGTHAENQLDRTEHGRCPAAERPTCPSGHSLVAPNLRKCLPYRVCVACARANSAVNEGRTTDRRAYADMAYLRIMGIAA